MVEGIEGPREPRKVEEITEAQRSAKDLENHVPPPPTIETPPSTPKPPAEPNLDTDTVTISPKAYALLKQSQENKPTQPENLDEIPDPTEKEELE
ncbi:MAG: hypothetical protein WC553_01050 [Patescibacteria group bacterium]|jgi:hypothetical protein